MAVKKKKKSKPINKELANKIRGLEVMLKFTVRHMNGESTELNDLFTKQADRLRSQLEKVKQER